MSRSSTVLGFWVCELCLAQCGPLSAGGTSQRGHDRISRVIRFWVRELSSWSESDARPAVCWWHRAVQMRLQ